MSDAQHVLAQWREAFNAHDERGLRSLYGDDVLLEAPGDVRVEGRGPAIDYAMNWLDAFPDAVFRIENEIASKDWVVQRFTFEGTHLGTFIGSIGEIPPTRRRLRGRGVQISRVAEGQIAEDHLYFDQMQMFSQLGLVAQPAGSG